MFAGNTNNHEMPASVTRLTPAMLSQWLVSSTRIGRFRSSFIV
jgi:hypothetical protein